ncbi:hypothetical protein BS47DRAFT_336518 [Hydnum rufescens UP504]|uniref:Uncharacterized protein n=1 Tax=Hydnum rufescens UP504 TaxID=1448309 RepID=A0A9P6B627_9AGAM|nr:hypothetical protein BS47DRAFT_336518 [Hydnum rufescens UP504]
MSREEWFDEQAKSKRGHSEPLTPLLPLSPKPLPDPRRVPSLKRLPSLDAISSLPVSRRRRGDSPVWEHAETGQRPRSAGHPASSPGHKADRSDERSVSLGTAHRAPVVHAGQLCHSPAAEDSKKRSSCSAENPDNDLLDILSVLMMLATESMNPSIEDWIRFASKNSHRTPSSWINFHETHEKLFRSLVSRLDPPEDSSPAWNNFSSHQALSLARFLAKQGVNPNPRNWRDFSKQHESHSLESWVAFKNHFGRSLMRLMREYHV